MISLQAATGKAGQSSIRQRIFIVTVRELGLESITYPALGSDSAAVIMAAVERFGVCAVTAKPR